MSTSGQLRPKACQVDEVGKTVKSSKKKFTWVLEDGNKDQRIELFVSFLSGKKKIVLNGRTIHEEKTLTQNSFQYSFTIGTNMINISQKTENFDLRINNQSFSVLFARERTKREFTYNENYEEDDYKTQKTNKPSYQNRHASEYNNNPYGQSKYQGMGKSEYQAEQIYKTQQKYLPNNTYNKPDNTSIGDVLKIKNPPSKISRREEDDDYDDGLHFDHGFDKFDFTTNSNPTQKFNVQQQNPKPQHQQQQPILKQQPAQTLLQKQNEFFSSLNTSLKGPTQNTNQPSKKVDFSDFEKFSKNDGFSVFDNPKNNDFKTNSNFEFKEPQIPQQQQNQQQPLIQQKQPIQEPNLLDLDDDVVITTATTVNAKQSNLQSEIDLVNQLTGDQPQHQKQAGTIDDLFGSFEQKTVNPKNQIIDDFFQPSQQLGTAQNQNQNPNIPQNAAIDIMSSYKQQQQSSVQFDVAGGYKNPQVQGYATQNIPDSSNYQSLYQIPTQSRPQNIPPYQMQSYPNQNFGFNNQPFQTQSQPLYPVYQQGYLNQSGFSNGFNNGLGSALNNGYGVVPQQQPIFQQQQNQPQSLQNNFQSAQQVTSSTKDPFDDFF